MRDSRLSRRILAARAEFRQGAHFLAVDAEHILLLPAALRKFHALVENRVSAEGLRLIRHELKCRARSRRGERHRKKSQSRARVCDGCGKAKCTAAPSENTRKSGDSRSARKDKRGDFSDACESCRRRTYKYSADERLWQRHLTLAIVQQGGGCHRKQHTDGERQARLDVEARVDGGRIAAKPCEKRHRHADEYDDGEKGQGKTAEQEEEFAASMRRVRRAFGELSRTPDEKRKSRQRYDRIDGDKPEADARAAERMHGEIAQKAASREERAVERERIGEDSRKMRECEIRRAHASGREQVDEDARSEPRHERRVLHGIPAPPAAPAEHLVRPESTDEDARTEERPGDERPASRKCEPRRAVRLFRQQRPQGRRIRHGEQCVAKEHERRMNCHPWVLQERIHSCAVSGRIALRHGKRTVEEDERRQKSLQEEEHGLTCVSEPCAKGERRARRRMEEEPQEE